MSAGRASPAVSASASPSPGPIIREPQLLILDDATSAVDPSVEQAILARLREASSGTTVLVVAYRMATILLADEVVYVEGGRRHRPRHARPAARRGASATNAS